MQGGEQVGYGPFAAIYNRYWGGRLADGIQPVLDELLLRHLPAGAHLLDLCCGTGQVAAALSRRGYEVTGIDICEDMLRLARVNAPACRFLQGDARSFEQPAVHDAVLSTSEALNEIAGPDVLSSIFGCVHRALRPGGRFVFGVLLAEDFTPEPERTFHDIKDDYVLITGESFDAERHSSRGDSTLFYRQEGGTWQRWDTVTLYQFYSATETAAALLAAGFMGIEFHQLRLDLGESQPARRTYVSAIKAGAAGGAIATP